MSQAPGGLPCLPVIGCNPAGQLIGSGAGEVAKAVLDTVNHWIADGTAALLGRVGSLMAPSSEVNVNIKAFDGEFHQMWKVGKMIVLPMLLVSVIGAVIKRDPGRLMRTVGAHLPLAILGTFVALELTQLGLSLTDQLCKQVIPGEANTEGAVTTLLHAVEGITVLNGPAGGGFVAVLAMLLVAFGAMMIWLELVVRTSAIYIAVLFLPVVLAGLVWPTTARWTKRLIEILVALILAKFVIVAVISLGTALIGDRSDGLQVTVSGAAVLLMAGFAPFALLRMVPLVEASVISHMEGMERRPFAAAAHATTTGMALFGRVEMAAASAAERSGERSAESDGGSRSVLDTVVGDNLPDNHHGGSADKCEPLAIDATARELEPPDGD
jgi:hypothetical protein